MWVLLFRFEGKRLAVPVMRDRLAVGRADDNDVILRFPGVSRKHCEFLLDGRDGRHIEVRDSGSKMGVLRRGERLEKGFLSECDSLLLGPVGVFVQRDPSTDWVDPSGKAPSPPFIMESPVGEVGADREPGGPIDPRLFEACLDAFLEGGDWGRRWCGILGMSDLEVVHENGLDRLCLWPAAWTAPPDGSLPVMLEGRKGRWLLYYSGDAHGALRSTLRALLQVLEVAHTRPAHRKPPPVDLPKRPREYASFKGIWEEVEPFLESDLPLLISGETGVGKEVFARAIHQVAGGPAAPFEVIHCAAIPETLFESEIFGIEANTASGVASRRGKLELADGGTILLDEVGEVPPAVQAKLLRVLQDATVTPIGGRKGKTLRLRWLSATNKDLRREAKEGRFREDLFYRLCGTEIRIPPLRERPAAIPELVEHFLNQLEEERGRNIRGLSVEAYRALMVYPWPGNVRELFMAVKRAYYLAEPGGLIQAAHLPEEVRSSYQTAPDPRKVPLDRRRKNAEETVIRKMLAEEKGNVTRAAERLSITRQTLAKRLKDLGIRPRDFKGP